MSSGSRSWLKSRRWAEKEARAALDAHSQSGLSVAEFADREGLDAQRLYSWRRRLSPAPTTAPRFIEVKGIAAAADARFEIELRSGYIVRVPSAFDSDALRRLIAALESSGC